MKIRLLVLMLIVAVIGTLLPTVRERLAPVGQTADPAEVEAGDREVAFFHTSTAAGNWERLIAGLHRATRDLPGLSVDDSRAFLDRTTGTPEVAVRRDGCPGRLLVRWYKLGGGLGHREWVQALARRDTPPVAVLGGGSSDRAVDLAQAMEAQTQWNGPRPLFLISTATANQLDPLAYPHAPEQLMQIYPGRTFRFCFHNRQMARAVLDYLFGSPGTRDDLRPAAGPAPEAVASLVGMAPPWPILGEVARRALKARPIPVFSVAWKDDPYSIDLAEQFEAELNRREGTGYVSETRLTRWRVPYSVGRSRQVNSKESELIDEILRDTPTRGRERAILLLPTVAQPARRILQALTAESPFIGQHLVALNGDGLSMNNVYRDGEFTWNIREVPVPTVFFCHQNPIAWDSAEVVAAARPNDPTILRPPTSTEDVLLMSELLRVVAEGVLRPGEPPADADGLRESLVSRQPAMFDAQGNRMPGGEYLCTIRPTFEAGTPPALPRIGAHATIEVWRRDGRAWQPVGGMVK